MTVREETANVASRPLRGATVTLTGEELHLVRISLQHELNRTEKNIERLKSRLKADYHPAFTEERAEALRTLKAKLPRA